jgi:hypothetical protein
MLVQSEEFDFATNNPFAEQTLSRDVLVPLVRPRRYAAALACVPERVDRGVRDWGSFGSPTLNFFRHSG